MRNYCRVYHTSLDHLSKMPIGLLLAELEDAAEDLAEERRQQERRMKEKKSRTRASGGAWPRHRR